MLWLAKIKYFKIKVHKELASSGISSEVRVATIGKKEQIEDLILINLPLCVCLMQIIGINHNRDYWDWNAPRRTPWFFCLYGITVVVDSLQRSPVSPLIASRANIEKWYRALVCATRRVTQFFVVWPVTGLKKTLQFFMRHFYWFKYHDMSWCTLLHTQ